MFRGRRGQHRGNLGVMLLAAQLYNYGFNRIPPVTLVTILSQVAIFLGLGDLTRWFSSSYNVCISTHLVWRQGQWSRLILGSLYHGSDMHLYYNMISFLSKGSMLERKFRSVYFAYLLVVFTALSSISLVGLNYVLAVAFDDRSYELTCAVGFSAVIFALKVLAIHYSPPGRHYAMGFIPVPSKYIYWVELGLIQLLVPNASFTGHLAGILVGLAYTKGPLKLLMDSFIPPEPSYTYRAGESGHRQTNRHQGRHTDYGRGYTTGYRQGDTAGPTHGYNTRHNQGYREGNRHGDADATGLSEEEQIRRATDESLQQSGVPSAPPREEVFEYKERDYTDLYTAGLTEEEQIRRAMDESQHNQSGLTEEEQIRRAMDDSQHNQSGANNLYPDLNDLRQRRENRYN